MNKIIQTKMAQAIINSPDVQFATRRYVSVYRIQQCYGGPEEGGWWYDVFEFICTKPFVTEQAAETYLAELQEKVDQENADEAPERARAYASLPDEESPYADCGEGRIPTNWSDGGELIVRIENRPGESDNSRNPAPHYE